MHHKKNLSFMIVCALCFMTPGVLYANDGYGGESANDGYGGNSAPTADPYGAADTSDAYSEEALNQARQEQEDLRDVDREEEEMAEAGRLAQLQGGLQGVQNMGAYLNEAQALEAQAKGALSSLENAAGQIKGMAGNLMSYMDKAGCLMWIAPMLAEGGLDGLKQLATHSPMPGGGGWIKKAHCIAWVGEIIASGGLPKLEQMIQGAASMGGGLGAMAGATCMSGMGHDLSVHPNDTAELQALKSKAQNNMLEAKIANSALEFAQNKAQLAALNHCNTPAVSMDSNAAHDAYGG